MRTSCTKQTTMYELTGKTTRSGKRLIVPARPDPGTPFRHIMRPCGSCTGCRIKRRMDWSKRLEHESEYHEYSWFVTLTYAPEHLPHGGSLYHEHISKFVRALRQKMPDHEISYFGSGEYGKAQESNQFLARPHYHLIIFGPDIADRKILYSKPNGFIPSPEWQMLFGPGTGVKHFESDTLSACWHRGFVEFSHVSTATMSYVTKFHIDKVTGDLAEEHYETIADNGEIIQRERETARMSKNPAIGLQWIQDNYLSIYPHGYMEKAGVKFAPPAYYDRWLEENHPEMFEELKINRSKEISLELLLSDRRNAIELCRQAQINLGAHKIGRGTFKGSGFSAEKLTEQFNSRFKT